MCCNIHGLILYLATDALVVVKLYEFNFHSASFLVHSCALAFCFASLLCVLTGYVVWNTCWKRLLTWHVHYLLSNLFLSTRNITKKQPHMTTVCVVFCNTKTFLWAANFTKMVIVWVHWSVFFFLLTLFQFWWAAAANPLWTFSDAV